VADLGQRRLRRRPALELPSAFAAERLVEHLRVDRRGVRADVAAEVHEVLVGHHRVPLAGDHVEQRLEPDEL
jgi:hypothetical protein